MRVYVWSGRDPALTLPARDQFVETLRRNGLGSTGFVELPRPLASPKALESLWAEMPTGGATHALVLTRQFEQTQGGMHFIRYEAVLWDAATRQLVWLGKLASAASYDPLMTGPRPHDADKRAERLAADLLRGLERDGFFTLNGQAPRDAKGEAIGPTWLPLELR
ncbi:hypothetical protein ABE85_01540 [Mitsuaria sp. 7]|nr:hypothetical protein ABE85_01540 [Mitsuaria sp. 7]